MIPESLICDECMTGMTPGSVHSTVTETSFIGESPYEVVFYFCSPECALMRMSTDDPRGAV